MGMKIKIKRWIVTLTLLFLGVFLPLRSQPQSRIPVDTGEVNPSNPPRFKGFRASPSSIIQFYFSEAGKRFLMGSPNPKMRDMGRLVVGNGSYRASSTAQPIFGVRVPSFHPGTISGICSAISGCKFNLELPTNAVPQNEESVDFIRGGGLGGEDLIVQGSNDYRVGFGTLGSLTGYYVSRDMDGTPEFEGGLPALPDPLEPGDILIGGGDPVIAADPIRGAVFAADLRFDVSTTGIGVFRTTKDKLNSGLVGDCPDGTHAEPQAAGCWPTKKLVNPQPSQASFLFLEDKPHLAVDERDDGPVGAGDVYVTGTEFSSFSSASRIWLVACNNALTACSAPVIISGSDTASQFSHVAVRPDGGVTVTYIDLGASPFFNQQFNIKYVRCSPAAAPATPSCSPATLVYLETQPLAVNGFLGAQDFRVVTYPKHDHRTDGNGTETYVVWDRCKVDPSANIVLGGVVCPDADVVYKGSTDNGITWSTVSPLSVNASAQDQFFPWIKTDRSTGIINIVYYTSQNDPTFQHRLNVYLNHINPDGVLNVNAITDTHVITSVVNDPAADPLLGGYFLGDYIGVAARGLSIDGASRAYCGFTSNDVQGSYSGVSAPQQDNKLIRLDY